MSMAGIPKFMQKAYILKIITKCQRRQLHTPRDLRPDATVSQSVVKKIKLRTQPASVPRIHNKKYAAHVCDVLEPHLHPESTIIECHSGKGVLTRELFKRGFPIISCWEPATEFSPVLEKLKKSNRNMEVIKKSFFQGKGIPTDENYDKLQKNLWEKEPQVKVIALLHPETTSLWMSRNAHNMIAGSFPHSKGRAEFFFFITGREHQLMFGGDGAVGAMNGPVPRRIYDYELFYDKSTLSKIPLKAFDQKINFGRIPKTAHWDQNNLYLVRITPRKDLFTKVCNEVDFPDFILFTQQLFRVRRVRLIPRLEQWCPNLGLLAIDLGYSMMDTVKQLHAWDLPILFKKLKDKGGMEALKHDIEHPDVAICPPASSQDFDKTDSQESSMDQETLDGEVTFKMSQEDMEFGEKFAVPNSSVHSIERDAKEADIYLRDSDLNEETTLGLHKLVIESTESATYVTNPRLDNIKSSESLAGGTENSERMKCSNNLHIDDPNERPDPALIENVHPSFSDGTRMSENERHTSDLIQEGKSDVPFDIPTSGHWSMKNPDDNSQLISALNDSLLNQKDQDFVDSPSQTSAYNIMDSKGIYKSMTRPVHSLEEAKADVDRNSNDDQIFNSEKLNADDSTTVDANSSERTPAGETYQANKNSQEHSPPDVPKRGAFWKRLFWGL